MSDRRLWAKIDRGYLDNEKMVALLDESPTALLMHLASILYCTTHLTDGHVAPVVARRKVGGAKSDEDLLIRAGLWHPPGHDCTDCPQPAEGRIYVHDFLEHNEASSQVKRVSEKRSRAARARWDKERDAPAMQSASKLYANAMPEERRGEESRADNKPSSSDVASDADTFEATAEVVELCDYLAERVRANGHKVNTVGVTWHKAMDRIVRLDGYTPDQIRQVIDWSTRDEFWGTNIRSAAKLREKFDTLKGQMFNARNRPTARGGRIDVDTRRSEAMARVSQHTPWTPDQGNVWTTEGVKALEA